MIRLKPLITENRRYEAEVGRQSRYIVNQFKNAMQSGTMKEQLPHLIKWLMVNYKILKMGSLNMT